MVERKPIFYDQERRRWRRTRRVLEIIGGLFTIILVIFTINVFRKPELPDILAAATHWNVHALPKQTKAKTVPRGRKRKVAALGKVPQNYDPLRAAFYVS
jgi:peptidoglycan-N-acetylglucosamine deacetylase